MCKLVKIKLHNYLGNQRKKKEEWKREIKTEKEETQNGKMKKWKLRRKKEEIGGLNEGTKEIEGNNGRKKDQGETEKIKMK